MLKRIMDELDDIWRYATGRPMKAEIRNRRAIDQLKQDPLYHQDPIFRLRLDRLDRKTSKCEGEV